MLTAATNFVAYFCLSGYVILIRVLRFLLALATKDQFLLDSEKFCLDFWEDVEFKATFTRDRICSDPLGIHLVSPDI